ncbi:SpoIID/LytB domain-containing protein [Gordonia sp. X0973]|uniref:SpoIID/LytB domain-containing protein n=1 Tax=Gordonia sp. X0973 TaxID=2742602 RepID=UPI000F52720A|nr:SpoIID/LytB domain-containing protein [Gordonia sp. X0973]QKT05859.1 SpoIID/LytB domain-containing protein [Gordonia sp. X0973]
MRRRFRNKALSVALSPVLVVGGISAVVATGATVTTIKLTAGADVKLVGKGLGHGRGMGQWGAFGYAKKGWPAEKILQHYYGGTTAGKADKPEVSVILTKARSVNVRAGAGMRVGGQPVAPGQAVRLAGNTATVTAGCNGPVVKTVPLGANPFVDPVNPGTSRPPAELLTMCGSNTAYRGALGVVGGKVVNRLHVDDYVKGVIPRESLPKWADEGGKEALKAQAIAARTYALAALGQGKKIDDTMNSQVYGGAAGEDPRTNVAADATAGQILLAGGGPAFTEFSASTGGHTAGGNFPAVVDDGDAISPAHDWTATVSADSVGHAFGVGALKVLEVVEANGLGPNSGRAIKVRAIGSTGTKEVTGEEARSLLKLKSSWFSVVGQRVKPKVVAAPGPKSAGGLGPLENFDLGSLLGGITENVKFDKGAVDGLLGAAGTAFAQKQVELGGPKSPLGKPLGVPALTDDGSGVQQRFTRGVMFYAPKTGVAALSHRALKAFNARGGLVALGVPTADAF